MGRPKEFDPAEKLERARRLFNEKGYTATTVSDLVEALEINRKSLYAEFGGKHELFDAALDLHLRKNNTRVLGAMESKTAGMAEIRAAIERWGSGGRGRGAGTGCLLCNTASELSANDPMARKHVRRYMKRTTAAFRNALQNARDAGELLPTVDVDLQARFFTSHAMGQLTLIRSKVVPEVVEAAAQVALAHLASLEKHPR